MGGMQQQPPRREIKLMTSIARQERVEDPNVWKPKHAVKSKEDDTTKVQTDVRKGYAPNLANANYFCEIGALENRSWYFEQIDAIEVR